MDGWSAHPGPKSIGADGVIATQVVRLAQNGNQCERPNITLATRPSPSFPEVPKLIVLVLHKPISIVAEEY